MVAEGEQRGHVPVGDEPDIASLAAVTAVRAAMHDQALAAEADAASAAVTAADVQPGLVDEVTHGVRGYGLAPIAGGDERLSEAGRLVLCPLPRAGTNAIA